MTRALLLLPWLAACASARLAGDLSSVHSTVAGRAELGSLALPRFDLPDEVPEEVDALLARPLTANAAVRVALLANREARAALAEVGIARGRQVQAGLVPNPELELEVRAPGGPQPPQVDVGVEYAFSAALLAPLRASVADAALDAAKLRAAGALLDLAWETKVAFLEAQAAQQRLELKLRFLASQQASYEAAVELSKAGNLPALTLASELAAVELARVQVAEAESALLDAREALSRKMGLTGARTGWTLEGPLTVPEARLDSADAEAKAVRASLELAELERRAEAASRDVRLARVEGWLPHLSAGFHGERDGALWELGAHLTVSLPVFDRAQGRELEAKSEYDGLRARREAAAVSLRSVVRRTLNRVESAQARAKHYASRLLPARERQLEQTLLQYNAMQLGVFEVLQAQRGVTETALDQVDATLDYWRARASLELLLAGRSSALSGGN